MYSHINSNPKFKFVSKYLSDFIPVFFKDKNNLIRKYFSLALKRHLMNENIKNLFFYIKKVFLLFLVMEDFNL